jgi:hypothetical protein
MKKNLVLILSGLLVTWASAEDSFLNQSNATEQKAIGISSSHMYKSQCHNRHSRATQLQSRQNTDSLPRTFKRQANASKD